MLTEPFDNSDEHLLRAWAHVPTEDIDLDDPDLDPHTLAQRRRILELRNAQSR